MAGKSEYEQQAAQAQQPVMSAQEVQQAIGSPGPISGMGNVANGAWYSQMRPGGQNVDTSAFMAAGPGQYNNIYAGQMQAGLNSLLNQKPFTYDVNADGLYQQIKDNYIRQGKQAMMDTQGQSAALTGGYGNSYGVQASQQAYQESLGNLAGLIPQLQEQAYGRYRDSISDQRANLEAMRQLENQDYTRWLADQEAYQKVLKDLPAENQALAAAIAAQMRGYSPTVVNAGGANSAGAVDLEMLAALQSALSSGKITQEQYLAAAGSPWTGVNDTTKNVFLASNPYFGQNIMKVPADQAEYGAQKATGQSGTGLQQENNNVLSFIYQKKQDTK